MTPGITKSIAKTARPSSLPASRMALPSAVKTILLVDDDPQLRSLTRSFLETRGYTVLACGNAEWASEVVRSSATIDLLITDMYMPHRSGMELGTEMKTSRPTIPVLLISGGILKDDQTTQLKRQGWSFLDKPFGLPQLQASVDHLLGKQVRA